MFFKKTRSVRIMKLGTFLFKRAISNYSNQPYCFITRSMSGTQPSIDILCQIDGAYKQPIEEGEEHDIKEFEEQENRGHPLVP